MPAFLLRHEVVVEPYLGASAYGPRYGPQVTVAGLLEQGTRTVRAPSGAEVTSSSTLRAPLDAPDIPPQSRVTLPDGDQTTVIAVLRHDGGGLPTPDHVEVQLA
ncbi:hypothetical protein [Streptomyces sp. DH12]|uniref:hypothetical protein n=1 Tax=Streptomyces sp. DH12 TaxID=2857010 RepID=UPI001E528539|nr:hypothetical protein [Streptomyces sp. DH12]